ncbi:hypothetical protein A0H81_08926 [Grifola frondosa]|uniref:Major facilitator superfamily (MFS) profile domain-containing protein n=1 Tax=Grifola frondosa TaxID=5627 RepID=A0A1C7M2E1_GRIFR|nr:hypothetical protein A0H81_08926 [Grifola frondosa]
MIVTIIIGALSTFAIWSTSHTSAELIVFAVVFGITAAAYTSISPSCTAQLTPDPTRIGARIGIFMTVMSPGILTGPSIGGALISARHGSYIGLQCFVGAALVVGGIFAVAARSIAASSLRAKF